MNPDPRELEDVSVITLQHYNAHADEFREGTRAHDVSQNNSNTTIAPPGYRVSSSPGSQACGASRSPDRSNSPTRRTGQSACGSEAILRTDIQPGYWPAAPMRVPC